MTKMKPIRFSVGAIIPWIIAVIALCSVYLDHRERSNRERLEQERATERQAVAEIGKLGGFVTYGDPPNFWVKSVTFIFMGEVTKEGVAVVNDTKVTDEGLKHLKQMTKLQSLHLAANKVTDEGLKHLTGLASLQTLHLSTNKVTDAGLEHIKGLIGLKSLSISSPNVTDEGLASLGALTNLQSLCLINTSVTDEGVEELQQALPNCKITHPKARR